MLQVPRKQVVEKASRALEREAIEMDRRNRTYTLLEDSESDGDAGRIEEHRGKKKTKHKDKATKRKHIRQKKESDSSSEDEPPKRYFSSFYRLQCHLHNINSLITPSIFYTYFLLQSELQGSALAYPSCHGAKAGYTLDKLIILSSDSLAFNKL